MAHGGGVGGEQGGGQTDAKMTGLLFVGCERCDCFFCLVVVWGVTCMDF